LEKKTEEKTQKHFEAIHFHIGTSGELWIHSDFTFH
jgi:hypothetical protein